MIKMYAVEMYVDISRIDEIILYIEKLKHEKYYCKYLNFTDRDYMIRLGLKNISKKEFKNIIEEIKILEGIIKTNINNPPEWHYEVELIKYLSYQTYKLIEKHFIDNKKVYENLKTRKFDKWKYPVKKKDRAKIDTNDIMHYLHHTFNLLDYGYAQEVAIYETCKAQIHLNSHISNIKS